MHSLFLRFPSIRTDDPSRVRPSPSTFPFCALRRRMHAITRDPTSSAVSLLWCPATNITNRLEPSYLSSLGFLNCLSLQIPPETVEVPNVSLSSPSAFVWRPDERPMPVSPSSSASDARLVPASHSVLVLGIKRKRVEVYSTIVASKRRAVLPSDPA